MRVAALILLLFPALAFAQIPDRARQYERDLIRNARVVWGIDAPVATFAAQVHQESVWRPDARSPFANGLAQFTPATADWISGAYGSELGSNQPFNPAWALRALVRYDKHLWDRVDGVTDCERMAFTLSAYNGGLGWVNRDKKLALDHGANPRRWFGHVEHFSRRAAWAIKENRGYPRMILLRWQPLYERAGWGRGIDCGTV